MQVCYLAPKSAMMIAKEYELKLALWRGYNIMPLLPSATIVPLPLNFQIGCQIQKW